MKKRYLNMGGIIGATLVACVIYNIVLGEKIPLLSIDTMQIMMNQWARHWHVLAVGLLPVYVACVCFGAIISGVLLGSLIQHWLLRVLQHE